MKKALYFNSRQYCLLLLCCFAIACNRKDGDRQDLALILPNAAHHPPSDSISIAVSFTSRGHTGFNIKDRFHQYYFLEFANNTERDTTVVRKIPRIHTNQIIDIAGFITVDGNPVFTENYFLADSVTSSMNFKFSNGSTTLAQASDVNVDSIHSVYNKLGLKIKNIANPDTSVRKQLGSELERLYKSTKSNSAFVRELAELYYIYILQMLYPMDQKIDEYMQNDKMPIASNPFSSVLFKYTKDRIDQIDLNTLGAGNYNDKFLHIMSVGIFNFLRFEDNKGNPKYEPAASWLKTTPLYTAHSDYITKEISPLDSKEFKRKLAAIPLYDIAGNSQNFESVLKKQASEYFLLDFWATWCGPCIEGVKTMKGMTLPAGVSVISISTDKESDRAKWARMTAKLGQQASYRISESDANTRTFLQFTDLKSIPRYILVNRNMDIIDQAFHHPQEPEFLSSLAAIVSQK